MQGWLKPQTRAAAVQGGHDPESPVRLALVAGGSTHILFVLWDELEPVCVTSLSKHTELPLKGS